MAQSSQINPASPAVYLLLLAGVIAPFAIPAVRAATGISPVEIAAVLAVYTCWALVAHNVLVPRRAASRRAFDLLVIGNAVAGASAAAAIPVLAGSPSTVLWCVLVMYATANGSLDEFDPSIILQLIHAAAPLATIPVFWMLGAGPWSVAGPVLAAAFAMFGYHLVAVEGATTRAQRRRIEARLAVAERVAADLHLARDLHDVLGSALGTVKLHADLLAGSSPAAAMPLSDVAQAGLDDLRSVLDALAPPGGAGLRGTIESIGRRLAPAGLDLQITGTWPENLPGQRRVAVARIIQEAVYNAVRHGAPTAIQIEAADIVDGLRITVRDDGGGFDPAIARAAGRGLAGIEARVAALGGTVTIASSRGAGATITAMVPTGDPGAP